MTMHTAGWLEVRVPDWDGPRPIDLRAAAPTWEAIVYLEPFITWEYEEASRRVVADQLAHSLHSGMPADVSARVQADYDADVQAWAGVALPQWAEWSSIAHVNWQEAADSSWRLVLDLAKQLTQRYGAHNLRLVLWSKVVMG